MEMTATPRSTSTRWVLKNKWVLILGALVIALIAIANRIYDPTEAVLATTIRLSTPLVLGALCGLIGERTGVVNIGIEGQMLLAAFVAFLANVFIGNLGMPMWLTLTLATLIGALTGAIMGGLLAFMAVTLKMDQIIGGTVINILAVGLTGYFYTANLTTRGKFAPIALGPLADIPLIGPVLFDNPPITYLAIILVFVVHYMLFYTRWGLRSRAVGEHPRAADTVGISVIRTRYINVILAGAIAGLGGAFLTLEGVGSFERQMTNGRGFLALAIMIFGKWTPLGSWGAALFFGFLYALQNQLNFEGVNLPPQFIGSIPYVVTIVVLAGLVGRSRGPAAAGQPYETEG